MSEARDGGKWLLAVGTYTSCMPHVDGRGEGIHLLRFDRRTGSLDQAGLARGLVNPSYLAVSPDRSRLYAVREVGAESRPGFVTFEVDATAFRLNPLKDVVTPGGCPCHVSVDSRAQIVLVSNHATGEVLAYPLDADGIPADSPTVIARTGEQSHSHCAIIGPAARHLYVADIGTDHIVRYRLHDGRLDDQPDLRLPAARQSGPRHLLFTASGQSMLVNYEGSSTLRLYRLEGDSVQLASEVSSLPAGWAGVSHAGGMRLHPSGRFVYVGNRGHDSIFCAEVDEHKGTLTPVDYWPLGGRTPRDLAVSPDGRHLLAASQDDGFIRVFAIDEQSGRLTWTGVDHPIQSAVCLQFI